MSEAADPTPATGLARLRQFSRDFWVINGIELLERGAYYSLGAVLTVYMLTTFRNVGMGEVEAASLAGSLGALLFLLLYTVPLVAAAIAEKTGYKAALTVCFTLLLGGYLTSLVAGTVPLIFAVVILVGFGAGIFKPIAAAMVSQTTTEDQRNFAFTIYYGCINLGALIFPLGVGLAGVFFRDQLATIAFAVASALTALNLLLTLTVFRNVRPPRKDVNVLGSLRALGEVFRYPSFLVLLVIYSGFWFMYAMSLTFLAAYMVDFARMPAWFNEAIMLSINAGVIILAAPILGPITEKFNSVPLMIVGITMYAGGLLLLGFTNVGFFFIGGIVVFSIGELLTHPSYLSYVSKIAPPEKVSVFLGYGFIPVGIGLFFGSSIGGALYGNIAREQGRPELFWAIMASVGLVTVAAFLLYNMVLGSRARQPDAAPAPRRARFAAPGLAALVLLLVPAVVAAGALVPAPAPVDEGVDALSAADLATTLLPFEGETEEGAAVTQEVELPATATGAATFVLTWTDEAAGGPGSTNAPDTFRMHVTGPDGTMLMSEDVANPQGGEGRIEIPIEEAMPGAYTVEIEMVDAGDSRIVAGPLGALPAGEVADGGNAWTLEVGYQAPESA